VLKLPGQVNIENKNVVFKNQTFSLKNLVVERSKNIGVKKWRKK